MTHIELVDKAGRISRIPTCIDIAGARIEEASPGRWVASILSEVFEVVDGVRIKVSEFVANECEISIDDATAELTRRGEMTGHDAVAARRRAMSVADPVERIIPRPAGMNEDQILEAIGHVTQDVIVGTGNPATLGLCGDRDDVEAAVRALEQA